MTLHRFLPRFVLLPFACAAGSVGQFAAPVWAQNNAAQTAPVAQPASLSEALQTLPLNWDTSKKGVLLWVLISDKAEPYRLKQPSGFITFQSPEPIQAGRNGVFRVQDIAARFERHIVSARTVTAFVPTLTTVLATRLPAPDFYADLTRREKLRRLEATLSPSQWRLLGSSAGLGLADLQPAQKKLWAALIPATFSVAKRSSDDGMSDQMVMPPGGPMSLSPAQQAQTRLVLSRHLGWYFANMKGDMVFAGSPVAGPEGSEVLTLMESSVSSIGSQTVIQSSTGSLTTQNALFGTQIKEVVPDYAKPSQLAYDSSVLDAGVVLAGAKTVGELINAVKAKTGVEIYCDVRYRDLLFYTKGGDQTVRAGDALQALALAVSGTFRKVDDGKTSAYVLTDDLEGLGTRQVRISEWMQAAVMASEAEKQKTETALNKVNIGDYVAWAGDDAHAPSGALSQRIEAYRAGKERPTTPDKPPRGEGDSGRTGLWISSADLPASVQNAIRRQSEAYSKKVQEEAAKEEKFRFYDAPLRTDRVQLQVSTSMALVIPGVGRVDVSLSGNGSSPQELLPRSESVASAEWGKPEKSETPKPTPPFRLTQTGGNLRALLVALPLDKSGATDAVASAKAHGFNQLWVELPVASAKPAFLTETISEAKAKGIKVQAVVPVLRRLAGIAPDLPRDRNTLGETMNEWATRRTETAVPDVQNADAHFDDYVLRQWKVGEANAVRQKERGDFLDTSDSGVESAVVSDLLALSRTPDLAGIVACDLAAPGSDGNNSYLLFDRGVQSLAEDFGYTPALRLRFLQETGIDPVDLSPLPGGELPRISISSYGNAPSLQLPQMPDYGFETGGRTINGVSALEMGAKNGWSLWNTFRRAQANLFWNRLQKRYTDAAPDVPLLRQNENRRVMIREAPVGLSRTGTPRTQNKTQDKTADKTTDAPAQKSRPALLTFRYDPNPAEAFLQPFDRGSHGFSDLLGQFLQPYQSGWDGIIIDISSVPLDEALPLLQNLPADPAEFISAGKTPHVSLAAKNQVF